MREILFRGKCPYDEKWIYGDFTRGPSGKEARIRTYDMELNGLCTVIPETVGQYTGLNDKNGKKIFEGDIIAAMAGITTPRVVFFEDGAFRIFRMTSTAIPIEYVCEHYEIIGNIHDNPELLEV